MTFAVVVSWIIAATSISVAIGALSQRGGERVAIEKAWERLVLDALPGPDESPSPAAYLVSRVETGVCLIAPEVEDACRKALGRLIARGLVYVHHDDIAGRSFRRSTEAARLRP